MRYICVLCLFSGLLFADWPEFRGPGKQGHAEVKTVPVKWNAKENIAWRTALDGQAWSSPVLQDNKLFLSNAITKDNEISLWALCIEANSGKILWNKKLYNLKGASRIHKKNSHASPTPIVTKDRVFIHFGYQGTSCLDLDGNVIWTNRELHFAPVHGNGGSPALIDNMLVFHCDGSKDPFIAALDAKTGKLKWKTIRKTNSKNKFAFCTPLLIEVNGQKQIISPAAGAVFAYTLAGKEIWRCDYGNGYSIVPRPVYAHGMIYVSSGYDRPVVYAVKVNGKGNVTNSHIAWTFKKDAPRNSSMIVVGEEIYMQSDRGQIACLDAKTGKVHYSERALRTSSSSPFYAAGNLYFTDESGKTVVVKPGKTYQEVAVNEIGERTLASIAVGEGRLFYRSENAIYCIKK